MYHVCDLEYHDVDIVPFAEQITVLLFETIDHSVLDFHNYNHHKLESSPPIANSPKVCSVLLNTSLQILVGLEDVSPTIPSELPLA